MSHPDINNKDILQEIMDEQKKLDRNIIKTHDLFNNNNEIDLTANFDELRRETLGGLYLYIRTLNHAMRMTGPKWWKNQPQLTDENTAEIITGLLKENVELIDITNISMKNIAIMQELFELEDAVREGKSKTIIYDEYIDIIHFVISLGLELGINSAETIREYYLKKNNVNHHRIQSNY